MPYAIVLISVGGLMVYSALKGVSVADAFRGAVGNPLNPAGGRGGNTTAPDASGNPVPDAAAGEQPDSSSLGSGHSTSEFKGPNAALLAALASAAVNRFALRITQICRPQNASYGSPTSLHKECRAFDAVGKSADMLAFARYAHGVPGVDEVFYDPAGYVAPGYDHGDHVHVGA